MRGHPPAKDSLPIKALSDLLNVMGRALPSTFAKFRNTNGVYMKLMNLRRLDPAFASEGRKGLSRGGKGEEEVWNDFYSRPDDLRAAAEAIRVNLASREIHQGDKDEDAGVAETEEGRILTRVHLRWERSQQLVKMKRADALKKAGKLDCEACAFDFSRTYGDRGDGFMEVHHTKPLHSLQPGTKTRLDDLALL